MKHLDLDSRENRESWQVWDSAQNRKKIPDQLPIFQKLGNQINEFGYLDKSLAWLSISKFIAYN